MNTGFPQALIETIVRKAIRDIQDAPKRNTRNLVDMALNFSEGRFQSLFLRSIQSMLKNEDSAYYRLIPDMIVNVDTEKIVNFGINLGYNSCTAGAKKIRALEKKEQFNIPWSMTLLILEKDFEEKKKDYLGILGQGKKMGIYTWMLYAPGCTDKILELAAVYPECAFVIYCDPWEVTDTMLDEAESIFNVMFAVRYGEGVEEACTLLRIRNFLYSVLHIYKEDEVENILDGSILDDTEILHPVFTGFAADRSCSENASRVVYKALNQWRGRQQYPTILWDITNDNRFVDSIISGDPCSAAFDWEGQLFNFEGKRMQKECNIFQNSLSDILN